MDEGQARNLIQPTMSIKWNSGSLLDMEAHMPSVTQNNPKGAKRNHQRKRYILNHNGPEVNLQQSTTQHTNPSGHSTKR